MRLGTRNPLDRVLRTNFGSYAEIHVRACLILQRTKVAMYMSDTQRPKEGLSLRSGMLHSTTIRKISDSICTLLFCISNTWAVTCRGPLPHGCLIAELREKFIFLLSSTTDLVSSDCTLRACWPHHPNTTRKVQVESGNTRKITSYKTRNSRKTHPLHRNVVVVKIVLVCTERLHHEPHRRQRLCVERLH